MWRSGAAIIPKMVTTGHVSTRVCLRGSAATTARAASEPAAHQLTDLAATRAVGAVLHAELSRAITCWPPAQEPPVGRWPVADAAVVRELLDSFGRWAEDALDRAVSEASNLDGRGP